MLQNTERRVSLSCFTEVSCRTDGSRRWRIDFIQRCVSRCSMNAALGGLHLCLSPDHTTFPIASLFDPSVCLFFRAFFLLFSPFFFLLRFWIIVLYRNSIKGYVIRIETVEEIGELLSGMEFWELDSWSFLKAYNSSWERSLLARMIFCCFLFESWVHYIFLFSFFRSSFLDLAKLGYNVTSVLVSNSLTTHVLKIGDLHTKIEDNKLKTNSLNAELTD